MSEYRLEQKEIQSFLPHRQPFLLVDRILSISGPGSLVDPDTKSKLGIKVVGIKNVSMNEPHFAGHFPDFPIMPGVLIIESMAQVASFAMYPALKNDLTLKSRFQCVLVGVDQARFRVPVVPGDVLRIETEVTGARTYLWSFLCKAYVEDKLVAEAKIMANLMPMKDQKDS
jgi:3-hydroxyacyl-[acyl-carrier-protein] dehydratase